MRQDKSVRVGDIYLPVVISPGISSADAPALSAAAPMSFAGLDPLQPLCEPTTRNRS